jgi:hypothetical protein
MAADLDWHKASKSAGNGSCVEVGMPISWSKATKSFANGDCVEIGKPVSWNKASLSMGNGNCVEVGMPISWSKAALSMANGNCVEVGTAQPRDVVHIRDTKSRERGMITVTADTWRGFVTAIRDGEFQ